jgi:hypothetical protein
MQGAALLDYAPVFQAALAMLLQHILLTQESFHDPDLSSILSDNSMILEALFARFIYAEELPEAALQSYYVEAYRQQMHSGGLLQFIDYSAWHSDILQWIVQGLSAMGAVEHLKLFLHIEQQLAQLDDAQWQALLEQDIDAADENPWQAFDQAFLLLDQHQDLQHCNAQWLRQHSQLLLVAQAELAAALDQVAAQVPDVAARIAAEKAQQPRYYHIIDALCEAAQLGHAVVHHCDLEYHYLDQVYCAWLFDCDQGSFVMLDLGSHGLLLEQSSQQLRLSLDIGHLAH